MQEPGEPQFYTFDNRSETIERNETRLTELAAMGQKEFSANLRKRQNDTQKKAGHDKEETASHEDDKDDKEDTTSAAQRASSSRTHTSSSPALS